MVLLLSPEVRARISVIRGLGYEWVFWNGPEHNPMTTELRAAARRGIHVTPYPGTQSGYNCTRPFQRFAPLRGARDNPMTPERFAPLRGAITPYPKTKDPSIT